MLYIASDHGGFETKEYLKQMLSGDGVEFRDQGPEDFVAGDDYPPFAQKVAKIVSEDSKNNSGILICRSGHGECIAANRFKNVHATLCWNEDLARVAKNDDDSNILCLPADYISHEEAYKIVKVWMQTPFSADPRHVRRLEEIEEF